MFHLMHREWPLQWIQWMSVPVTNVRVPWKLLIWLTQHLMGILQSKGGMKVGWVGVCIGTRMHIVPHITGVSCFGRLTKVLDMSFLGWTSLENPILTQ